MSTINTFAEFINLLAKLNISAVYLFIGNGAKLQYSSLSQVKTVLTPTVDHLDSKHGAGRWLAVYGGDTWVEDKPDLGTCMHWVKQMYNPYMMAVQGWEECDKFVDFVYKYEEEKDDQGRTVY